MTRGRMARLTAKEIEHAKPGKLCDGAGLWLVVGDNSKSWVFRYKRRGRERFHGLGSAYDVSAVEARRLAAEARALLRQDRDPIDHRDAKAAGARVEKAKAFTFDQCAAQFMAAHQATWHNAEHRRQWKTTLATYVNPIIGGLPVAAIDTPLVLKVLEQKIETAEGTTTFWLATPVTADRVRNRIENIIDFATTRGYRDPNIANPARWRGLLAHALPKVTDIRPVAHHAALAATALPELIQKLSGHPRVAPKALHLLVLTGLRTDAIRRARWSEIDLETAVWVVPSSRMKRRGARVGESHRLPLSAGAMTILNSLPRHSEFVFVHPNGRFNGRLIGPGAIRRLLQKIISTNATPHGMRSAFSSWSADHGFPPDIVKAALAHANGDKVQAAYQRSDLFRRRRALMEAWDDFCAGRTQTDTDNIISMNEHKRATS
jgi:integrase